MSKVIGDYSGNFPEQYRAYTTQYGNQLEVIGWKWWDTQTYVSGTTTQLPQWFNIRATQDLGNMQVAFQLAAPQAFLLRAIRFFIKQRPRLVTAVAANNPQTGAFDNVAQLINTGVFTFSVGNKTYAIEPLWCLPAGGGAMGALSLGSDLDIYVDYAQNGVSDPRAVNTLSKPLFIPPQMNFSAVAQWPAPLTLEGGNTDITFLLDGDLLRPVQ